MKKTAMIAILILTLTLVAAPCFAQFPKTVVGAGIGHQFSGPNKGHMMNLGWFAYRLTDSTQHDWAFYAAAQYAGGDYPDVSGVGGKVIFVDKTPIKGLCWLFGAGWIQGMATNAEGNEEAGITFETGLTYSVGTMTSVQAYLTTVDRGEVFDATGYFTVSVNGLKELLGSIL